MQTNKITVAVTINADSENVWNYYTNPEHITRWNFADPSWHCPSATNDMRVGGTYSARMEAKDGSFGFEFEAVYDEIIDGEKLTYTMADGRQATVCFKNKGNQTEVMVSFDPEDQNLLEVQKDGWQSILDNFKKYAETN